jgi:hypothetical protein
MAYLHGRQVPVHLLLGRKRHALLVELAKKESHPDSKVTALIRKWVYERLQKENAEDYSNATLIDTEK